MTAASIGEERFLDLRDLARPEFNRLILNQEQRYTFLVTAYQTQWLDHDVAEANAFAVVLPDILRYEHLLATGQPRELLELSGSWIEALRATAISGVRAGTTPLSTLKQEYWTLARALMHYDIALISGWFKGRALLHHHLSDLAFSLGKPEFIETWLSTESAALLECRRGLWTRQIPLALSSLSHWSIAPDSILCDSSALTLDAKLSIEAAVEGPFFRSTEFLSI